MTIFIFVLIAFGIMNIIHHITMIEQLKHVKRNQLDMLDSLENIEEDMLVYAEEDMKAIFTEIKNIKQSINNINYQTRNQ